MKRLSKLSTGSSSQESISPPDWKLCPAKSAPCGKTLLRHALESGAVFEALRDYFHFPERLLPASALLFAMGHDCGKLSPGFLCQLPGGFARENHIPYKREFERHHAVISEAAFLAFLAARRDRCETIVGWHHGRRNPVPLPEGAWEFGGEAWRNRRREFLEWVSHYAELPPEPFSPENRLLAAGVVCLADWIASDQNNFAEDRTMLPFDELKHIAAGVLERIGFRQPEFRPGMRFEEVFPPFSPNSAQRVLAEQAVAPGIFLLENTMGSGKTEAALYAAYRLISSGVNRGIFFALPTRLTSNKIHERVESFLARVSASGRARLIHGSAWLEPAGGEELAAGFSWFAPAKRALLEPFGVGTIDQALKGVLNVKHFFLRLAGLAGKVVIIDEVHAFDAYMHELLIKLCRVLVRMDCTVILLSATLPAKRRAELLELADGTLPGGYPALTAHLRNSDAQEIILAPPWRRKVRITTVLPDDVAEKATEAAARGCNVALIANTVGEAQEYFRRIRSAAESGRFPIGLLHSRFPLWRREEIEQEWLGVLGKDAGGKRPSGSVLVSTQIIEQSVDMDFDLMISDLAPGELLFQRMGRLWRHPRDRRPNAEAEFCRIDRKLHSGTTVKEVLTLAGGSGKVYAPFLLFRAEEVWRKRSCVMLPDDLRPLIEENFRPPEETAVLARELYDRMEAEAKTMINRAGVASQLDLITSVSAQASDDEDAPTRLADSPQRNLLLLKSISECGRECALVLSDGTELVFRAEERFSLEKMRRLAANTAPVPAWWVEGRPEEFPQVLERYYKFDEPVPAVIGAGGGLTLPSGSWLPIRYDNQNGVCYECGRLRKEEDETLSFDW